MVLQLHAFGKEAYKKAISKKFRQAIQTVTNRQQLRKLYVQYLQRLKDIDHLNF